MINVLMVKISIKRINKEGLTPLHIAAGTGAVEGVVAFLDNKDVQEIINLKDRSGRTPLLLASSSGNKEVAKLLLKKGASIRVKNKHRESSLHLCARYKVLRKDLTKIMLDFRDVVLNSLTPLS